MELEDGPPARFHRSMLRICALIIVTIGIWASITPIRELAIAPGQILPKGDVRSVQHLEGGIVAEILVQAGDRVAPGTPLLRLANEQAGHDLAQLKVRAQTLRLQKQQIAALLTSTALDL
ncbi:MAG: HlyD family type I secretion periplasmic adaptor subunit, partial [Pseudomonadota bacterium]